MLAKNCFRENKVCRPHAHTFAEDLMIADCFRANNVYPYDTRDEFGFKLYMLLLLITISPSEHITTGASLFEIWV